MQAKVINHVIDMIDFYLKRRVLSSFIHIDKRDLPVLNLLVIV
jgi:hypothetical protein